MEDRRRLATGYQNIVTKELVFDSTAGELQFSIIYCTFNKDLEDRSLRVPTKK
jgi:hypothetical protein